MMNFRKVTLLNTPAAKVLLMGVALLLCATDAHASKRWTYCSVNTSSEVWVSKVFQQDWDHGGMEQMKTRFKDVLLEQFPGVHPQYLSTLTCVGESSLFQGFDEVKMVHARNREMKEYSAVHEVPMKP